MKPPEPTLSEILQAAPQQRTLWERLGIDIFRCRNQTLAEVCRQHDLDPPTVARLLAALRESLPAPPAVILELLTPDELCEHIERSQHARLRAEMAELDRLTSRAAETPGGTRLRKIRTAFLAFRSGFAAHLHEECAVLFPSLRRPPKREGLPGRAALRSRLARLVREHRQMDEALVELEALAGGGKSRESLPSAAWKIAAAISRLHHIVQEQIYTENRILFPQALARREP